jgi:hypothetical protein
MRSFASLTTLAIVGISLTAAAPTPVAELNARQWPWIPFPSVIPSSDGLHVEFNNPKALQFSLGPLQLAIRQPSTATANEVSSAFPAASSLPSVAARQLFPPLAGFAALQVEAAELAAGFEGAALEGAHALEGAELPAGLQGAHSQSAHAAPAATPSTHVRRQGSNPFSGIEGFLEGQAKAQESAFMAAESAFGALVASQTAEHGAASPTPEPTAAAKRQLPIGFKLPGVGGGFHGFPFGPFLGKGGAHLSASRAASAPPAAASSHAAAALV